MKKEIGYRRVSNNIYKILFDTYFYKWKHIYKIVLLKDAVCCNTYTYSNVLGNRHIRKSRRNSEFPRLEFSI